MNANELATKAIREGLKLADENTSHHRDQFETEDIESIASTLSAGLVVLKEDYLRIIIKQAYHDGSVDIANGDFNQDDYASRIMREVKEGNDGQ